MHGLLSGLWVFEAYTATLDCQMVSEGRHILLMMDNASSHMLFWQAKELEGFKIIRLSHITLLFLPVNPTSVVQPLDAGIIRTFKAKYCVQLLNWCVLHFEARPAGMDLSCIMPNVEQVLPDIMLLQVANAGELRTHAASCSLHSLPCAQAVV